MFEILAFLFAIALLALIALGIIFFFKKIFGHSFNIFTTTSHTLEETEEKHTKNFTKNYRLSFILKGVGIVILSFISISILNLLSDITNERNQLYNKVTNEIGDTWGNSQSLSGPVLVIPYSYLVTNIKSYKDKEGEEKTKKTKKTVYDKLVILPKNLDINISLKYDFRYRGIYQAMVYNANIVGNANFSKVDFGDKKVNYIGYNESYFSFGISDNKAIQKVSQFSTNNQQLKLKSGTNLTVTGLKFGFHAPINFNTKHKNLTIQFSMALRGSKSISVLPLAENTNIKVTSNWQHPSFYGMLPNKRNITKDGFSAHWKLSHLARNYPQTFNASNKINLNEVSAGTMLYEPVTHYSKIERSVKYGILFVGLTFLALFIFDLRKNINFSMIQYFLVGTSLSLFYLLLLSLSEHINFLSAYISASLFAIISISTYVGIAAKEFKSSLLMVGLLSSLYTILYSVLQLEQFALLTGTILLILITLIMMYITRHMAKP